MTCERAREKVLMPGVRHLIGLLEVFQPTYDSESCVWALGSRPKPCQPQGGAARTEGLVRVQGAADAAAGQQAGAPAAVSSLGPRGSAFRTVASEGAPPAP